MSRLAERFRGQHPPPVVPFYRERPLEGPLSRVVEAVWTAESEAGPFRGRQTVIPDATVNWIFNFGDPYVLHFDGGSRICADGGLLVGVRSHHCLIEVAGHLRLLGIRFRPGGLGAFVDSAADLANQFVAGEDIFGESARTLESRLRDSAGDVDRVGVIEQTLLAMKGRAVEPDIQRAIDAILQARGLISIGKMADQLELGYKRLERGFLRAVGLTPKPLARTIRMLFVVHDALHRGIPWITIAVNSGFYDQSHLIAEMKEIIGTTPGSFTQQQRVLASVLSSKTRLSNLSNPRAI